MDLTQISYAQPYWIVLFPLIGAISDIVTGWIQASVNGTWDSTKMRVGLYRKGGEILVVLMGIVAEFAIPAAHEAHVATFLSLYIVLMEAISVIENLDQAGIVLPAFLKDKLKKVKDNTDKGEE